MLAQLAERVRADESKRNRLKEIISERSVETGDFQLAAGGKSNVFFDMKMTLLDPEGINLAADIILDMLEDEHVDAIGGLIIGACPIVDAVCLKSYGRRGIRGFYVRKEPKKTGTRKMIEGPVDPGTRVVMVDDVTTTGASVLRAIKEIQRVGCTVLKVVTIVDRLEGAKKILADEGIELVAIFDKNDFAA